MLEVTKKFFMSEISREVCEGHPTPNLGFALRSLDSGYKAFGRGTEDVRAEVEGLIREYGEKKPLEAFLTQDDWIEAAL